MRKAKAIPKQTRSGMDIAILILGVLCVILVVVMIVVLIVPKKSEPAPFMPPSFDENAIAGTPDVPEGLGYSILERENMSFRVGVCGIVNAREYSADIYLTNPQDNNVWLKLRIYDEKGTVLGETGVIKPGEYVKSITFETVPQRDDTIVMKIMSYEAETYHSMGAITMMPRLIVSDTASCADFMEPCM